MTGVFQDSYGGDIESQLIIVINVEKLLLVMNVCEAIAVVNYGRIIAKGTPEEIRSNPAVIEAYLGKEESDA